MTKKFNLKDDAIYINNSLTIAKYKSIPESHFKRFRRVGGICVWLLKDFLKQIKDKDEDAIIGVYIEKKSINLVPFHCRNVLLAPMGNPNKRYCLGIGQLKDEGRTLNNRSSQTKVKKS